MIISGTGSRNLGNPLALIRDRCIDIIQNLEAPSHVISGGAEGFDHALCQAAAVLQLPYHLYLPNPTYGQYYWGQHSTRHGDHSAEFEQLCANAAHIKYTSQTVYLNGQHSNFARNTDMVQAADAFLVYDKKSAGAAHCLSQIRQNHKPFYIVQSATPGALNQEQHLLF